MSYLNTATYRITVKKQNGSYTSPKTPAMKATKTNGSVLWSRIIRVKRRGTDLAYKICIATTENRRLGHMVFISKEL